MTHDLRHALDVVKHFDQAVGWPHIVTALLHDAVEDGACTLAELTDSGMPLFVVEAVDTLTRRQDETYADYIERVDRNQFARLVKIADLRSNLARTDCEHESLRDRYEGALARLTAAELQVVSGQEEPK